MNAILMAALMLHTTISEVKQLASFLLGLDDGYANMEYVDLMLPSKTLWAQCNLGAQRAEDCGDYYAWGELKTKSTFGKANYLPAYREYLPDGAALTYPLDLGTQLPMEADVARQRCGADWQLPTYEQIDELVNNCHWVWTKLNGTQGFKVYCKDRTRYIFLPAAGYVDAKGENPNHGMSGIYWTRETARGSFDKGKVYALYLDADMHQWVIRTPQSGYCIRPVTRSTEVRFDFNGDGKVSLSDLTELIRQTLPPPSL